MQGAAVNIGQNCYNIRFVGCTFRNNQAETGSAIYIASGCRNIVFEGCTFIENHATTSAGAIYVTGSELIIDGCTFTNNYIENAANDARTGGAIEIVSATRVTISDSTFENNRVTNTNTGGNSRASGGAIAFSGTSQNVNIVGNTFTNNRATGGATNQANRVGGAIYFTGGMNYLLIDDCIFIQNTANRDGGAVMFSGDVSNIHFVDSTFTDNTATYGGALMFNNNVVNSDVIGCTFTHNTANGFEGGAIDYYNNVQNVTISSTFINNIGSKSGPAVAMDKEGATFSDIKIINSVFKDHTSDNGTFFIRHNPGTLIIENTSFENNQANRDKTGAAVHFPDVDKLYVRNSNFTNNRAPNGGALYVTSTAGGEFEFDNCRFNDNNALTGNGGALYLTKTAGASISSSSIKDSTFDENTAAEGGAIYIDTGMDGINVSGSTFTDNEATATGGAIDTQTTLAITGSEFDGNTAVNGGGAIHCQANNMEIHSSNFTDNKATSTSSGNGGAVYIVGNNAVVE